MSEYKLVEKPILDFLQTELGYEFLHHSKHASLRPGENFVLFQPMFEAAVMRINNVDEATARAVYNDFLNLDDNEDWVSKMRGNYSRTVEGEATKRTIHVIDFDNVENNQFVVTNQLRVNGGKGVRKPDVVIYVNGIPLVVLEAKSPLNTSQNAWSAIHQVRSAEEEVPRLFNSNLFNIATNDVNFMYGATGAPKEFWSHWRDPWPRTNAEFKTPTEAGLYALLEKSRLLDILAHFIVFEIDANTGGVVKKVCRYQQYRAVNKMNKRVHAEDERRGLIWHTQGSGKSLTMAFATLKFKNALGVQKKRLKNPNILVITDRKDLDAQIAKTFKACGLPNPERAKSMADLRAKVSAGGHGQTVMGTIHKFYQKIEGNTVKERTEALKDLAVEGSENWIVLVDECHRTQEKDLGAYLRATLPDATFFGFTGTPVKKGDKDTFQNFGGAKETYLDKYGIDDAVRDGATVPIYYQGRMTEWHLEGKELDILFDQWFSEEPDELVEELKQRGVTKGDLARFPERIRLNALDMWAHYKDHVLPDGFKAQVIAIDRPACVLYKHALDKRLTKFFKLLQNGGDEPRKQKYARLLGFDIEELEDEEPKDLAKRMSVPLFSPGQLDSQKHPELVPYTVDEVAEKAIIKDFKDPEHPLKFLIVCDKYLTGFDAPVEQAMYLDRPLSDHNLLQAIARTNRRYGKKPHGIIIDYIGVSKSLDDALAAYRAEDVEHAMQDIDVLHKNLTKAHQEVMALVRIELVAYSKDEILAAVNALNGEDEWYTFRARAKSFLSAYAALSPDQSVLAYLEDMKFVAGMIPYGRHKFEGEEELNYRHYSEKIRELLEQHLEVTGLKTICKLRNLNDAAFWTDFDDVEDLEVAAVRKISELKKILREKNEENAHQYAKLSERINALIEQFKQGQIVAAEFMDKAKHEAIELAAEEKRAQNSGLSNAAYGIWKILEAFIEVIDVGDTDDSSGSAETSEESDEEDAYVTAHLSAIQELALQIEAVYSDESNEPALWQEKEELRRQLRGQVRRIAVNLKDQSDHWKDIPDQVEHYAIKQFARY